MLVSKEHSKRLNAGQQKSIARDLMLVSKRALQET